MRGKLDEILIVDIEATCWEGSNPDGMENDIIEIGIALLNVQTGEISENRGILVKPERSEVGEFCTKLTTITPQMIIDDGVTFREACSILKKEYSSQNRAWASFGT